jgi:hypothetical protein
MRTDLREANRIILAHGEVTGHAHEVLTMTETVPDLEQAQYFEEPDGTRMLLVLGDTPVQLRHQEHALVVLDPRRPEQVRQGDVLLTPAGGGAWKVTRQAEFTPEAWRHVAD